MGQEISLCHPDDKKFLFSSIGWLLLKIFSNRNLWCDKDFKCCYITGVNVDKKNVYSCIGISQDTYTIDFQKYKIGNGDYERLGPLTNINIQCAANRYSISIISLLLFILFF